jgi:hypothetical protein
MAGQRPRRRLALSLRALLLLVLVFGLWLGRQVHLARQQVLAIRAIQNHGGNVRFDYTLTPDPAWLRRFVGDEFFREIAAVWFSAKPIDPSIWPHLRGQAGLRQLDLIGAHVGDEDLDQLRGLRRLRSLDLTSSPRVTDAGIAKLVHLEGLEALVLDFTGVSDDGLLQLKALPRLRKIWVTTSEGRVTPEGVERLKAEMPQLESVYADPSGPWIEDALEAERLLDEISRLPQPPRAPPPGSP